MKKQIVLSLMACFLCVFPTFAVSWQTYNETSQSFLVCRNATEAMVVDVDGNILAVRNNGSIAFDAITRDFYDGTFWTVKEKNHSEIYNFTLSPATGNIILLDRIRYSDDAAKELECAVADPFDGTLWLLDDTTDQTSLIHAQRTGDGVDADNDYQLISSVSIYNANPTLGVASGQGMAYDLRTGTLWITSNNSRRIYNYTTAGVLINSYDVSGFVAADSLQGIYCDYFTNTLWLAERNDGFHHITTTGTLIKTITDMTGTNGPTGIVMIPRWFAPLAPRLWYKMDDAAAQTVVADEQNFNIGATADNITSVAGRSGTGSAIDFEESEAQFVTFTDTITFANEFAISFWIKFETLQGCVFSSVAANTEWIRFESTSEIDIRVGGTSESYLSATHGFTFATGEWIHIVIQRGTDGRFWVYKNGAAPASESGVKSNSFAATGFGIKNSADSKLDAVVDEYMLFNYSLSQAEISRIYNGGRGIDDTFDLIAPGSGKNEAYGGSRNEAYDGNNSMYE